MKTKQFFYFAVLSVLVLISACKKEDDPEPSPSAGFTVTKDTVAVDEVIQFTNTSANATAFAESLAN